MLGQALQSSTEKDKSIASRCLRVPAATAVMFHILRNLLGKAGRRL